MVAPLQLTDRDLQIIRLVHRHRFLRSSHVIDILCGSGQSVLRRLQLLYHQGFLERPRAQLDYYHQGGSRHIIYGMGSKGAAVLKQQMGLADRRVRWGEKNRTIGRIYLDHVLLVSDVMVAIELACMKKGLKFIPGHELIPRFKPQSLRWKVGVGNGMRLGVIPDCVFAVEHLDEDGEPKRAIFFLEADRATMPVARKNLSQTSLYRKLLSYEATWSQGIHKTFGFHRFRVVIITTSAERVKSLVEACSKLKHGHGLFLFADKSVLRNPDLLSSPLWQTGRPGEFSRLID